MLHDHILCCWITVTSGLCMHVMGRNILVNVFSHILVLNPGLHDYDITAVNKTEKMCCNYILWIRQCILLCSTVVVWWFQFVQNNRPAVLAEADDWPQRARCTLSWRTGWSAASGVQWAGRRGRDSAWPQTSSWVGHEKVQVWSEKQSRATHVKTTTQSFH